MKQSALILALFLGAASADKPAPVSPPEKVHTLEPEVYQVEADHGFPSQRTAFYLQTEPEKLHTPEHKTPQAQTTFNPRTTHLSPGARAHSTLMPHRLRQH